MKRATTPAKPTPALRTNWAVTDAERKHLLAQATAAEGPRLAKAVAKAISPAKPAIRKP